MKNSIKTASISLAVSLALSTGSFAQTLPERATDGAPSVRYTASQVIPAIAECAWEGTKMAGNAAWYAASTGVSLTGKVAAHVADNMARYGVAYLTAYAGVEALNEVVAYGMYGAAYGITALSLAGPAAAPVAALTTYTMTRTTLAALHIIPGIDGALAATYTPVVRGFTDMAIDHGPAAISSACKTAYSTLNTAASVASTGLSSIYSSLYSLYSL